MSTRPKIKNKDNSAIRDKIGELYEISEQIDLANWSILCAKHVLKLVELEKNESIEVEKGFQINELWQKSKATVHKVRQVGFKVHAHAKISKTELSKTALIRIIHEFNFKSKS